MAACYQNTIKRILCVGECSLNIIHICNDFPCNETNIQTNRGYWQRGGTSATICTVLGLRGAECEFFGYLSTRPEFAFISKDFKAHKIDISNCPETDAFQPYSSIMINKRNGAVNVFKADFCFPMTEATQFNERIKLEKYRWIHFEGSNLAESKRMLNRIRRYNTRQDVINRIHISTDLTNPSKESLMLAIRADTVFASREFAAHMGWRSPKETVFSLSDLITNLQLKERKEDYELDLCFRSPNIIFNGHPGNVALLTKDYVFQHIASRQPDEKQIDIIGYNETFIAGYLNAIVNDDKSVVEAVERAMQLSWFKSKYHGYDCIPKYAESLDENLDKDNSSDLSASECYIAS